MMGPNWDPYYLLFQLNPQLMNGTLELSMQMTVYCALYFPIFLQYFFNTLQYRLPIQSPPFIGDCAIESVESFKLLGIIFRSDLTWSTHCNYITKKTSKRLYIIRQLRKAGYCINDLFTIYCSLIRPILEYAVPVWAALPFYLSDSIESIQKRAMRIIFRSHGMPYNSGLKIAKLDTLYKRRSDICEKFVRDNKQNSPLESILKYINHSIDHGYNLRSGTTSVCSTIPKTLRLSDFVTHKYSQLLMRL